MNNYVLASTKAWHDQMYRELERLVPGNWFRIKKQEELTFDTLSSLQPRYIFIPHWSEIIPASVYNHFECVVFHMTDLPFGRGGSPMQNLISRGFENTKISALKVEKGIDTGDVYIKKELDLKGTAEEIFLRSADVIKDMIVDIVNKDIKPQSQTGEIIEFKRRKPEQGNIADLLNLKMVYDYIRMLDCEGYPKAYVELPNFRLEFSRASLKADESILADVRIIKK